MVLFTIHKPNHEQIDTANTYPEALRKIRNTANYLQYTKRAIQQFEASRAKKEAKQCH